MSNLNTFISAAEIMGTDVNRDVKQNIRGSWWRQPGIFSIIYGVIKERSIEKWI